MENTHIIRMPSNTRYRRIMSFSDKFTDPPAEMHTMKRSISTLKLKKILT